ncbi:hypothetical protein ACFFMR_29435 [Micromonospora andamanensis]|uniref:DUF4190 domain-containing protein n=1 Tax=Micromonospora andamanensis TaxID=1287068 RepID=A0ABQ4HRV3_9ACTN|nr:hypothetical protein [Micromonospora andamanensis]GIJ08384.1 hypothetical protein Van01_15980 [Micromonospora andamanensis]
MSTTPSGTFPPSGPYRAEGPAAPPDPYQGSDLTASPVSHQIPDAHQVPGPAAPPGPPASGPTSPGRPVAVTLAVFLMVPAVLTWLIGGIAFFRALLNAEGDGLGKVLVVGIGAGVLAIALLVVLLAGMGILMAWTGDNASGLAVPAGFTFGLFVVVIVTLLAQGKLSYQPTMITPLVVGGLAGVSLVLVKSPPARAWFASRRD